MRKKTRFCAFLAALTMGLGILSGCTGAPASSAPAQAASVSAPASGAQAGKPDTSEAVTLTMYLIGDRPVDNDEVFAKINEKLKAEINATIDVKFMSWGEYEQKYPLIFASGEDWDIIYTADWCFYNAQATKQGFWEITQEALETYAPMTAGSMYPRSVGTGEGGRQGVHAAYELQGDYLLCISGARRPDGQIRYQIRCVPGRGGGLHGRHRGQ